MEIIKTGDRLAILTEYSQQLAGENAKLTGPK